MPRLPDDSALGGLPSGRSGRPIASVDETAIGRGMEAYGAGLAAEGRATQQVGAGLANAASTFAAVAKQGQEAQGSLDDAKATSQYLVNKTKLDDERDSEDDPEALGTYRDRYQQNLNASAGLISDPQKRELFVLKRQPDIEAAHVAATDRQFTLNKDATIAETNEDLATLQDTGLKAKDEKGRADAVEAGRKRIDALEEAGYIDSTQAQKLRQGWVQGYAVKAISALPPAERMNALQGPLDTKDAASVIRRFEGFRETPYWDETALRVGYGSDTITRADGTVVRVSAGMTVNRADAERDLSRRLQEFQGGIRADIGDEAWGKLSPQAQAALTSVAYNYGSLPKKVAAAAEAGDAEQIASAVEGLKGHNNGQNAGRRQKEADMIRGGDGPLAAPPGAQLASFIPEDQKAALIHQAGREWTAEQRDAQRQVVAEAATVKSLQKDDEASIMQTGTPVAELTPDRVSRALGPEAATAFERNRVQAQRYYDQTNDWDAIPADQVQARLATLRPEPGKAGFESQQSYFNTAQDRAKTLINERRTDPAAAADRLPEVQQARDGASLDQPETFQGLVKARKIAMDRLGIPEDFQVPITKAEAQQLWRPIDLAARAGNPSDLRDVLQTTVEQLKTAFGEDADSALGMVLHQGQVSRDTSQMAAMLLRKITQGTATPGDARAVDEAAKTESAVKAITGVALPTPEEQVGMAGPAEPPGPKTPTPDNDAIAMLRDGRVTAAQWDAVYGMGSAKKVFETAPPRARAEASAR